MPPRASSLSSATTGGSASAAASGSSAGPSASSAASSAAGSSSWRSASTSSAATWWPKMVSATEDLAMYYWSSEWLPRLASVMATVSSSSPAFAPTTSLPAQSSAPGSPAPRLLDRVPSPASPAPASSPMVRSSPSSPAGRPVPCALCKVSKRACRADCVVARYSPQDELGVFREMHNLFNINRMSETVRNLPPHQKDGYVLSRALMACARSLDPMLGLTGVLRAVDAELGDVERQLQQLQREKQLADAGALVGIPSAGSPEPPLSLQACVACAYMRRECAPRCPLAEFIPTAEVYEKAQEMFGSEGLVRLLKTVEECCLDAAEETLHIGDGEARAQTHEQQADPVHGAVGVLLSFLGGGTARPMFRKHAAAFLRWMLQGSPLVAEGNPSAGTPTAATSAMASARKSRCGACKVLQRKCTHTSTYAPYFPSERMAQFAMVKKVFDLTWINNLIESSGKVPQAGLECCVSSLVEEAEAYSGDLINGSIPHLAQQLIKLKAAQDELTAMLMPKEDFPIDGSAPHPKEPELEAGATTAEYGENPAITTAEVGGPSKKARIE